MELAIRWILWMSWFCGILMSDLDHTHGTSFIFMAPLCDDYHAVNVVVRWRYGARYRTVVTVKGTFKKYILSMGEEFPSSTIPCKTLKTNGITYSGAIVATSKEEIMLYVQYEQDNFMVYPVVSLSTKYTILTPFPGYMDKTFLAVTTPSKVKLKIGLPIYLEKVIVFNDVGYYPGDTIDTVLGRCDVLMIECDCDLTGVTIDATAGVMVVTGTYADASLANAMIEEVSPFGAWGKHVVFPIESWMYNITLKIISSNDSAERLIISTENSTESYALTKDISWPVRAEEYIYIQATSTFFAVFIVDVILKDQNTKPVLIAGVPLEQYPKFLCNSFITKPGSTCFVGIGNQTVFQGMFYQQVVDSSEGWYFAIVTKDSGLVSIPKQIYVWSYSPRILEDHEKLIIYSGAHRTSLLYNSCTLDTSTKIKNNDKRDNDCDGFVDEEFINRRDDDVDSDTDEDTSSDNAVCVIDYDYGLRPKSWVLLSNPMIAIMISILIAVIGVGLFIGGSAVVEILHGGHPTRPSRVEPVE